MIFKERKREGGKGKKEGREGGREGERDRDLKQRGGNEEGDEGTRTRSAEFPVVEER